MSKTFRNILLCVVILYTGVNIHILLRKPKTDLADVKARRNLQALSIGLAIYVQENDDRLPPMQDPAKFIAALKPYADVAHGFIDPYTGKSYRLNASLSGSKKKEIKNPTNAVVLYSPASEQNGRRSVIVVDNFRNRRVEQEEWRTLSATSHLPE